MEEDSSPVSASLEVTSNNNIENKDFETLINEIGFYKKQSGYTFWEIGRRLKKIREEKLYTQKNLSNFSDFLKISQIDMSYSTADRFMATVEDENLNKSLYLGMSKVTEILKLDTEKRKRLLSEPLLINGEEKKIEDVSLRELKKVTQNLRRSGKLKCDRCGRWVEHLKELDGKFYGVGDKHSCYEREIESRRYLEENAIPAGQLDNILDNIKETVVKKEEKESLPTTWLPESIYQIYGQFLQTHTMNSEEITFEQLQQEEEIINRLLQLLKDRLRDINDTIQVLENPS